MPRKQLIPILLILLLAYSSGYSQDRVLYKQVDTTKLYVDIYYPKAITPGEKYPAMVFFFGGGWNSGSINQLAPHAKYFSQRGLVCILADYRVKQRQQTTSFESLKDVKSAIRFVRENAATFHADTAKIIASGVSAGGIWLPQQH